MDGPTQRTRRRSSAIRHRRSQRRTSTHSTRWFSMTLAAVLRCATTRGTETTTGCIRTSFQAQVSWRSNDTTDADNNGITDVAAVYVQDQMEFSPKLELVAGLRYDSFH